MLMSYDEFDRMVVKYLNEAPRKNIKEILESIRVKVNKNLKRVLFIKEFCF